MEIKITTDYITLGQMLKYANIISSGSQVKDFLLDERVLVNEIREIRRGRKLSIGDIIEVLGESYTIQ
jgi:S4 domain protein YaaA